VRRILLFPLQGVFKNWWLEIVGCWLLVVGRKINVGYWEWFLNLRSKHVVIWWLRIKNSSIYGFLAAKTIFLNARSNLVVA
jgi:hypothetical protein